MTNIEIERKKARDFLAGDPKVTMEEIREAVPIDKERTKVIESQEKKTPLNKIKNPRLKTEAYLQQIGK